MTPATYTLIWLIPLPATGLSTVAILNDNVATVKWSTLSEQNTSHFIVERSLNNKDFAQVGNHVQAAYNSESKREYQLPDDITAVANNNVIYYRVKLVDIDGKVSYSNVVAIRLSKSAQISAWPNPFQTTIVLSVTSDKATNFNIRLMDISGKLVRTVSQTVPKGQSQITLKDFDKLTQGIYLLEIMDEKSGTTTVQKLLKK